MSVVLAVINCFIQSGAPPDERQQLVFVDKKQQSAFLGILSVQTL